MARENLLKTRIKPIGFADCKHDYIIPWQYWQERDTRTIVDIAERITGTNVSKTTTFTGTKHDALADAMHQARYVSAAFNALKKVTP